MNKRVLSLLLVLMLLIAMLPQTVVVSRAEILSGTCGEQGDNLTWKLDAASGTLTVSGSGRMASGKVLTQDNVNRQVTNVVVEEGVTSIGANAFSQSPFLTAVVLPDSLQSIGTSAFQSCTRLESVELGAGLTVIGDSAFEGCKALNRLSFPSGLKEIGEGAFSDTALQSVDLPDGLTRIGKKAFQRTDLRCIAIPDSVTTLGEDAFADCKIVSVKLGGGVAELHSAFAETNVTRISIPAGVTNCDMAFNLCDLTDLTLLNPNCAFDDFISSDCVVHGYAGSTAEQLAARCGAAFRPLCTGAHSWNAGEALPETLCDGYGIRIRTCTACGATKEEVIPSGGTHQITDTVKTPTCNTWGYTAHSCAVCGMHWTDSYTAVLTDEWAHTFTYAVTTVPTPEATGLLNGTCTVCGAQTTVTLPKLNAADYAYSVLTAPTCTASGVGRYTWTDYNKTASFDFDVSLAPLGHSYGEWVVTTPPTCTAEGVQTRTCIRCEAQQTQPVAALGHSYGAWVVTTPPTCTAEGVQTRTCIRCEAQQTQPVAALGHSYGEWVVTTAPTCTTEGVQTRSCARCGLQETQTIPAHDHEYTASVTAPTCTARGYTTYACSFCGSSYKTDYVNALGHHYDDWAVASAPTCIVGGTEARTCSRCGRQETRTLSALGHNFVNGYCTRCGQRAAAQATLSDLMFAFGNGRHPIWLNYPDDYEIPLERWIYMYGDTEFARKLASSQGKWGGSCFGFSSSSGCFFSTASTLSVRDFKNTANRPYDLAIGDECAQYGLTVRDLLEAMQIGWRYSAIQADVTANRDKLNELCRRIGTDSSVAPVIIALYWPKSLDPVAYGGHAVLGYKVEDIDAETSRIYVYDCNFPYPDQQRYIELTKDRNGNYTGWHYYMNNTIHVGSDYDKCWFTFITYNAYTSMWENRGHLAPPESTYVTTNSCNACLMDYDGNVIATIEDGEVVTERNDIYRIYPMDEQEDADDGTIQLWMPTDLYTIASNETGEDPLEITVSNVNYSAEITTTAAELTFAVDEEEALNYVQIGEPEQSYAILLHSGKEGDVVEITGTTAQEVFALGVIQGSVCLAGADPAAEASLIINGVAVSGDPGELAAPIPAATVRLDQTELKLKVGETATLSAAVLPETATTQTVNWSTSDPAVAAVSADGTVRAIGPGRVQIVAQADEVCAVCDVTVIQPITFNDVPEGAFYADAVAWAVENDITNGTSPTTFSPGNVCTRGQVVTFLWRAKNCPEPKTAVNPFEDVTAGKYYEKAVLWAVEKGITNGLDAAHFGPDAECTRGQVVTFLWRAEEMPEPAKTDNPFTDVENSRFYYKAILWAVERGITNGMDASHFLPDGICTRSQVVTFLYRDLS